MSDTDSNRPGGEEITDHDLGLRSESFEITPELVAANLTFGGSQVMKLPGEMISAVERIWLDTEFTWPTTISVTSISMSVEPHPEAEPSQQVWSHVSILGTGWTADKPVTLKWNNAFGFPDATIVLPEAKPGPTGFFGVDVIMKTAPKRHTDFVWDLANQLVLVAEQKSSDGKATRTAEQRAIPPHVVWQWIR